MKIKKVFRFDYTLPDGTTQTETRESNIVTTEILTYSFTKVKSSDKTFLQEGDIATQTVTLNNTSLLNISNIFFKDALSAGTTFVADGGIRRGEEVDSLLPPRISGCGLPERSFLRV